MKKTFLCSALVLISLLNCRKSTDKVAEAICRPPGSLSAQASCETNYPGVLLLAANYQATSQTQFIYTVYPQKDTLSNDISDKAVSWANASNERIVVPETAIGNSVKFLAKVSVNCNGKDQFSRYFAFVKRPAGSTCYRWVLQSQ